MMSITGKVVVFNVSSSGLKWSLLESESEALLAGAELPYSTATGGDVGALVKTVFAAAGNVAAVGFRVVHGGALFRHSVRVDQAMIAQLATLNELAPLHNPVTVACMRAALETWPDSPQVAAFDTAFHRTIPERAASYAIPREWTERWGIRRYGFHGLSLAYAVGRVAELLQRAPKRHIVCHLGVGCSVTAILDGRSVDTSMGFTPLDGVMMATRAGAIDPGTLLFLVRHGIDVEYFYDTLEHRSGMLGVSGVSSDVRKVMEAAAHGHADAQLAYDMFIHSVIRVTGGMVTALGGLDALTFTGGVGEYQAAVRGRIVEALSYLGLEVDRAANEQGSGDRDVASGGSAVRVPVITAREDLSVLREAKALLAGQAGLA